MDFFADIHCHPTIKPYGKSFPDDWKTNPLRINSNKIDDKSCIWHYGPPEENDKELSILGITHYSQSDFATLKKGNVRLIFSSLYPIEKGFFVNKLGTGDISDAILNLFTGVGKNRIDFVQANKDYFQDLENEYGFLCQLDNKIFDIDGEKCKYVVAKTSTDVIQAIEDQSAFSIAVVNTIEGGSSFGCGIDPENAPCNPATVIRNVEKVKNWIHKPLFVTLAHHFYNELCGHAESLDKVKFAIDQSYKMDTMFTPLGIQVMDALLDNTEGKRILIDIKHLSKDFSRKQFYELLDSKYKNTPIIVSHGAVTGSYTDVISFSKAEINFTDEEIVRIGKSEGLFGVMFDKGRLTSKFKLKVLMMFASQKKWSEMIWLQIQHIAEVLDKAGLPAWDIQTMGTDFDGVINPIKCCVTAEGLPAFKNMLLEHAKSYMKGYGSKMKNLFNRKDAEEIIDKVMWENVYDFAVNNL
jgi:microsomal dipeptidase-like Zn-dependent dipeptidase